MMKAQVVSIRGSDYATPNDCYTLPEDLRRLAQQIEDGEIPASRGLLVYQRQDSRIRHIALGGAISLLEACGLMAWAIEDIKDI